MRRRPKAGGQPLFWVAAALGWAVMAYGVRGLFQHAGRTNPPVFAKWFLGSALVHDLAVAPLVFLIAVTVVRRVPARFRSLVQAGLVVTGLVMIATFPIVAKFGERPDNPTLLPNNYVVGLALVLGGVWAVITVAIIRRRHAGSGAAAAGPTGPEAGGR